ncbi:MAG: sulfur oxidation c-type cytochrome SoxX [Pseudomonadota bacterium]
MRLIPTALAVAALATGAAFANPVKPAEIQFDDYGAIATSLTGVAGDAANGRDVMITRSKGNCVACHAVTALADIPFHGEVGPTLDGAADRWGEADLRGLVANAKMTFEGTIMPAFYKGSGYIRPGDGYTGDAAVGELPPILTAQEIEDVVAYLLTLKE